LSAAQVQARERDAVGKQRLPAGPMAVEDTATRAAEPSSAGTTVIAFDFGARRIGVAVGDVAIGIAHPLETIAVEDNRRRLDRIAALVAEWRPARLVLGFPAGGRDPSHPLLPALLRFERRLRARFGLPVERVDETLSSWDASRRLSTRGVRASAQKARLDAEAACLILQDWLDRHGAGGAARHEGRP
jgi:putative Holliday junction resolvase